MAFELEKGTIMAHFVWGFSKFTQLEFNPV